MADSALLSVTDASVYHGDMQALDKVSIRIGEGEIVSIIGANGAGKTTLVKSLVGILSLREGDVRLRGESIVGASTADINALGMVLIPEGREIFPSLTVLENLMLGAETKECEKRAQETVRRCFDLFPILKARKSQTAGTLSGGEQQMLAIGRGLMALPKVLLLDEPSLGLSPILTREIFRLVGSLNSDGVAVLLSEQNTRQSVRISNRAYVMENGRIVMEGRGEELLRNAHVREAYLGF